MRGTERLLRALQEFELEQFVFSSTMLVHAAARPGERIDEGRPLDPKFPYRASKLETSSRRPCRSRTRSWRWHTA